MLTLQKLSLRWACVTHTYQISPSIIHQSKLYSEILHRSSFIVEIKGVLKYEEITNYIKKLFKLCEYQVLQLSQ